MAARAIVPLESRHERNDTEQAARGVIMGAGSRIRLMVVETTKTRTWCLDEHRPLNSESGVQLSPSRQEERAHAHRLKFSSIESDTLTRAEPSFSEPARQFARPPFVRRALRRTYEPTRPSRTLEIDRERLLNKFEMRLLTSCIRMITLVIC